MPEGLVLTIRLPVEPVGGVRPTIDVDGDGRFDAIVIPVEGEHVVFPLRGDLSGLGDPGLAGAPAPTIDLDGDDVPDGFVVNTGGGLVVTPLGPGLDEPAFPVDFGGGIGDDAPPAGEFVLLPIAAIFEGSEFVMPSGLFEGVWAY